MLSISIGPIAVSVSLLTTIIGIIVFWVLTHWLTRKNADNAHAVDGVFIAIVAGFIVARIAFIMTLWSVYQENWWQVFNIRDGGFFPYYGWIASVLVLIFTSRGRRTISKVYLRTSAVTLCVIIPLHYAEFLYNSGVGIPPDPSTQRQWWEDQPANLQRKTCGY